MSAPADEPAVWIARAPCGCAKLVLVDRPENAERNAEERAVAERAGYAIVAAPANWMSVLKVECGFCRPAPFKRPAQRSENDDL